MTVIFCIYTCGVADNSTQFQYTRLLIWRSGNALVWINVVTLHRARLVPG